MVLRFGAMQLCRSELCRMIAGYGLSYTGKNLVSKTCGSSLLRFGGWGPKALNKAEIVH
jgi:hypothetical protein